MDTLLSQNTFSDTLKTMGGLIVFPGEYVLNNDPFGNPIEFKTGSVELLYTLPEKHRAQLINNGTPDRYYERRDGVDFYVTTISISTSIVGSDIQYDFKLFIGRFTHQLRIVTYGTSLSMKSYINDPATELLSLPPQIAKIGSQLAFIQCLVNETYFYYNVSRTNKGRFYVSSYINGDYTRVILPSTYVPMTTSSLKIKCTPRIRIIAATDYFTGDNIGPSLFRVMISNRVKEYIRIVHLTSVLIGKGCTLSEKVLSLSSLTSNKSLMRGIVSYGLIRYFLWFLITSKWTTCILLQRNTALFFTRLANSSYAYFADLFETPRLRGYDRYYKY